MWKMSAQVANGQGLVLVTDFGDDLPAPAAKRKLDQPEHRLSHYAVEMLDRLLLEDGYWTAIDNGTQTVKKTPEARMAWENHRRWMGIKQSHLDIYVYQLSTGIYGQFELKVLGKEPTRGQRDTMAVLKRRRIPVDWGHSLRSLYNWLERSGFRLHGNAENIVFELEDRHAAAERHAALKKDKPHRAPKPRAKRATEGQIARAHKSGVWRL